MEHRSKGQGDEAYTLGARIAVMTTQVVTGGSGSPSALADRSTAAFTLARFAASRYAADKGVRTSPGRQRCADITLATPGKRHCCEQPAAEQHKRSRLRNDGNGAERRAAKAYRRIEHGRRVEAQRSQNQKLVAGPHAV